MEHYILFQSRTGKIMHPDEVDKLSAWEIEELGINVFDDNTYDGGVM
jgi:hypothetical protein